MQQPPHNRISKRRFIGTVAAGCAAGSVFAAQKTGKASPNNPLLPPGATAESLEKRCVRCGICIQACPAKVLIQVNGKTGRKDDWKPMQTGECKKGCTLCGDVCPTGAIPPRKP